eukprot:s2183_g2.t1
MGGIVAYPASDFALRSDRLYLDLFGHRKAQCRQMDPLTAREAASMRLKAEKPRLSCKRKHDASSERAQLAAYEENVAKEPLSESLDEPAAIQKQKIILQKEEVSARAKPGLPVAYVDANGGLFRTSKKKDLPVAPALPARPLLHRAAGVKKPSGMIDALEKERPDVVIIKSFASGFDSAEAMLARLVGSRLRDESGKEMCFQPFALKRRVVYVSPAFCSEHALHFKALLRAYAWAAQPVHGKKGLEVARCLASEVDALAGNEEPPKAATGDGKLGKVMRLPECFGGCHRVLSELLTMGNGKRGGGWETTVLFSHVFASSF